jgi:GTP-binding protein EngB required for normal cell division
MSIFDRAARFLDDVLLLPDDLRASLDAAEKLLADGKAKEAEAAFRRILDGRPQLGRALVGWTRALLALGDWPTARVAIAEAQKALPEDPYVTLLSARLALAAGELGAAASASREASRKLAAEGGAPFAEACSIRAQVEAKRGRPDRAARELRKAVAATPDDIVLRVALAEAFVAADERAPALRIAREVPEAKLDDATALRLGLALAQLGEMTLASPLLTRAAARGDATALAALARHALKQDQLEVAETHARMAIARGGGGAALVLLAEVLERKGTSDEAAQALLAAASATRDPELFARATRAVPLRDARELDRVADAADKALPGLASTAALRAWSLLVRDQRDAARTLLQEPLEEPRALLAAAKLALLDRTPQQTLIYLDRAETSPRWAPAATDARTAAELRRDALRALWKSNDEVDLAAAIDGVIAFARARNLADGERRALALRDELDRPLLLAILGEFNAGKSTLVNAFLGADVAPTGILPTTATLNVLRSGAERLVRVVRKDGTTREGEHEALRALLREAEAEGAVVDRVEIVLPSELLDRVWVLDTPGSNAPNPEHESLAQEALRRADVALWVFDAGQAGKATEGRILAGIRESKREVIAALNKVDRLKPEELARVTKTLLETMPELGGPPVCLSARAALKARVAGDDAAYIASGFPALMETLERDVFARSRILKRRACAGRLLGLLADALATEPEAIAHHQRAREEALHGADALMRLAPAFTAASDRAMDSIDTGQAQAVVEAAREILSFVRPRAGRFGTHDSDPEDRAFLHELLVARIEQVVDGAATTLANDVTKSITEALSASLPADASHIIRAEVHASVSAPFAHFIGLQSGSLQSFLRRFFDEALPAATLSEQALADALGPLRASTRDELRPRLDTSLERLTQTLARRLRGQAQGEERAEALLVARTYEPLRALREVLSELVR